MKRLDIYEIKHLCKNTIKPTGVYDLDNCRNNDQKIEYRKKYYSREEIANLVKSIQNNKQ